MDNSFNYILHLYMALTLIRTANSTEVDIGTEVDTEVDTEAG